jgi:NitT/TauT family transport system substrate-binding protein
MRLKSMLAAALCLTAALVAAQRPAHAEANQVRIARQWGLAWMPFVLMERNKIIERRAKEAGLGDTKTDWLTFSGGNVMNDALLSGNLDYATTGIPGFLILWDKAAGALPVKAVSGFGAVPFALITRNPHVKTIKDFTAADKIALPTVKISGQAVLLQMAAEKAFGVGNHTKLDELTISRGNPDGHSALVSGVGEINSHFSSPPYQQMALKVPGVHVVLSTSEIFPTPYSNGILYTTQKFHDANPKLYKVVLDSLQEAVDAINSDKKTAVMQYLEITKEEMTVDQALAILAEPLNDFSLAPHNVYPVAEFMNRTGTIKKKPDSWKDLFFSDIHNLNGS